MRRIALILALCASSLAWAASGIQMAVPCQQNLEDGRILLSGDTLPRNARYKVLHYAPAASSEGWSHGQCEILVTRGASG